MFFIERLKANTMLGALVLSTLSAGVGSPGAPVLAAPSTDGAAAKAHVARPWTTFRDPRAGYTLRYPAWWSVHAYAGKGWERASFDPQGTNDGVAVTVHLGPPTQLDRPIRRCKRLVNHGLVGMQCLDAVSFTLVTLFFVHGKTYALATQTKPHPHLAVYGRMLRSFRLIR